MRAPRVRTSLAATNLKKKHIDPDAYFSITDPRREGKNTNHFFLELERAKLSKPDKDGNYSVTRKLGTFYDYYNSTRV